MAEWNWAKMDKEKLGRAGELFAQLRFISHGYDVYTPAVDDHGVDFVAIQPKTDKVFYVQVKSVRNNSYVYLGKSKIKLSENFLIFYLRFSDKLLPKEYIIRATVWEKPGQPFPKYANEYGISYSHKHEDKLNLYLAENFFQQEGEESNE